MAWKAGRYYVKNRRVGKRVISEYIGAGPLADYAESLDKARRQTEERRAATWKAAKALEAEIDALIDSVSVLADAYTEALMLVSGHHQHKRQWRKRRNEN